MTALGSARVREAVRYLRDSIESGRWPINSRIPSETELAAEMQVGRSTVREAVGSLARLGMLEPAPGRGTFVRARNPVPGVLAEFTSEHSWADLLEVRKALEVQAAQLAALRRDEAGLARLQAAFEGDVDSDVVERGKSPGQFHAVLVELAGNRLLTDLHTALMAALRSGISSRQVCPAQDDAARRDHHAALLAAIRAGDAATASAVAAVHADLDLRQAGADSVEAEAG